MTIARAKKVALTLLESCGEKLPVPIESLANEVGIQIRREALEQKVSGMLVIKENQPIIVVNQAHPLHRQRFTIAHELGHYHLHRTQAQVFFDESLLFFRDEQSSQGVKYQEIEANTFAAELLMPEKYLRQKLLQEPLDALDDFDDSALDILAKELEVSCQALMIRLTRLGVITI